MQTVKLISLLERPHFYHKRNVPTIVLLAVYIVHLSLPEQSIIIGSWFDGVVTVTVALRNKASLFAEALHAFHHDGHAVPHPLPQAHSPSVRDDADEPHREAVRWG